MALDIQKEIVDQGKLLYQTGAGQVMNAQILTREKVYNEKLVNLYTNLEKAIAQRDKEWKSEIEAEMRETAAKLEKDRKDRLKLQVNSEELKKTPQGVADKEPGIQAADNAWAE